MQRQSEVKKIWPSQSAFARTYLLELLKTVVDECFGRLTGLSTFPTPTWLETSIVDYDPEGGKWRFA
jgi:hypothetical protein